MPQGSAAQPQPSSNGGNAVVSSREAQPGAWPVLYRAPAVGHPSPQRGVTAVWRQPLAGEESSGKVASRATSAVPGSSSTAPPSATSAPHSNTAQVEAGLPVRRQLAKVSLMGQSLQPAHGSASQQARHPFTSSLEAPSGEIHGIDQVVRGEDSPGAPTDFHDARSLSSTTQTLLPQVHHGSADRARSADVLTSRVDEALMRLTLRVDEAIIELRAELPRARREIERQQGDLERVADEQQRSWASCIARIEAFESTLAEETTNRQQLANGLVEEATARADLAKSVADEAMIREELAKRLSSEIAAREELSKGLVEETMARGVLEKNILDEAQNCAALTKRVVKEAHTLELLERNLIEETEARCELEKAFEKESKDVREHVALEIEGTREMAMREMRERMDGQKVLREEVQLQQQALMGLTSRIDEALIELRTEMPTLRQETSAQKAELDKLSDGQASSVVRIETLEKTVAEESRSRRESERSLSADLRERIVAEGENSALRANELNSRVLELSTRVDSLHEETSAEVLKNSNEARESSRQLTSRLCALQELTSEQATDFSGRLGELEASSRAWTDARIIDCEASLHNWVEATTLTRVADLEKSFQKEMSERAGAIKDILDRTAHNTERWCQLQAKFDELLIEVL